jgi:hypothetical protein
MTNQSSKKMKRNLLKKWFHEKPYTDINSIKMPFFLEQTSIEIPSLLYISKEKIEQDIII